MKKLILGFLSLFSGCNYSYAYRHSFAEEMQAYQDAQVEKTSPSWPRSFGEFVEQAKEDTGLVLGRDYKFFYAYDLIDRTPESTSRVGAATSVLAWKFITVDPAISYTPSSASSRAEFEIQLRLRPGRIPMGYGLELNDLASRQPVHGWWDRVKFGFYLSQNLSSGKFGFGLNVWLGK